MVKTTKEIARRFYIAFLFFLAFSLFFRFVEIHFFAAPFIMLLYASTPLRCAWVAFFIGGLVDILQASPRLGFLGITYIATCFVLFRLKRFFFRDDPATLGIMVYLFSSIAGIIQAVVAFVLEIPSPLFSLSWVVTDCFIMPLLDVAFAMIFLIKIPRKFFLKKRAQYLRIGKRRIPSSDGKSFGKG